MYSDLVMEHFANPRNVGEVDDPTAWGRSAIRSAET